MRPGADNSGDSLNPSDRSREHARGVVRLSTHPNDRLHDPDEQTTAHRLWPV